MEEFEYENTVRLAGTVKRDAVAGGGVLDFAISVPDGTGRYEIFDCRVTDKSDAYDEVGEYVKEGEYIAVEGRLCKHTDTEETRACGVRVRVASTKTIVLVSNAEVYE